MRDIDVGGWTLADWSSRGPTADGRIKPDLVAPGSLVTAPRAGTKDRYLTMSGTSMSAPMVAGVAALMREANGSLSPHQVKRYLMETAQDWGLRGKDVDYGTGRLNGYRAIQRTLGLWGFGPRNPGHAVGWSVMADLDSVFYAVEVSDVGLPLALTLIMPEWYSSYVDFDLFVYDPDGDLVDFSVGSERQETIMYRPLRPGTYYIEV